MKHNHLLIVVVALLCSTLPAQAQRYEHPYVERKDVKIGYSGSTVDIDYIEIQKKRTVVGLTLINKHTNAVQIKVHPASRSNAHMIHDAYSNKIYRPIVTFGGVSQKESESIVVAQAHSAVSFKLFFDRLDDTTKLINLIEGTGDHSWGWSFYNIALMNESELAQWKQQRIDDAATQKQAVENARLQKIANEEAATKKRKEEYEQQHKQKDAANASHEASLAVSAEARTRQQTTKAMTFDGAYCPVGGSYIRIKPTPMRYGRFSHFTGRTIFRDYFLPTDPEYVMLPVSNLRFFLNGDAAAQASTYQLSEVVNVHETKFLIAYDTRTEERFDKLINMPNIENDLHYRIYAIKLKTISNTKAEIVVDEPLDKGKNYVLWSSQAGKYFFFKIK